MILSKKYLILALVALISMLNLTSCDTENSKNDDDTLFLGLAALATAPQSVNLEFDVTANGTAFESNKAITVNGVSNVVFRDFRFYVSEVKFLRADGTTTDATLTDDGIWQTKNLALLDFENGKATTGSHGGTSTGMNSKIVGSVPQGNYVGIQFTIGVPEDLNHLQINDSRAPLNNSAMYWAWASGYKHAKIEFSADTTPNTTKWTNMHLGSTGFGTSPAATACKSDVIAGEFGNCPAKFRPRITINGAINPGSQKIQMNIDELLKGYTHVGAADADGFGICMPISPGAANAGEFNRCNPLIQNLGLKGRVSNGASAINQTDLDAGVGSVNTDFSQKVFTLR
ncbi:MbnP family copper-binding protein [Leptospira sp. GIMC2001]|uniref:MbnP family copper-binding protein n=1 Tax=Leptospira sp. GIMC2001 TaxID=1513297 RepID=UPI00234A47E4|nr:MbnP family copper-binding protein [Leptospira sp. GIMC2001]WCL49205.1 metallo-mystery pair system four-Cys motif protein [Leptospira sp. GIMC2001]